jgi:hypothetical protein
MQNVEWVMGFWHLQTMGSLYPKRHCGLDPQIEDST